jgi:hypothetical protein
MSSTIWNFFHEVINLLPRTLEPKDIHDSRYVMHRCPSSHRSYTTQSQPV